MTEKESGSTELAKVDPLGTLINQMEDQAKLALPQKLGMSWERLARVFRTVVGKSEKLMQCTGRSLQACLIQSAELGLEPSSFLGHFYLVPFKNKGTLEATGIVGYRGMIDIARRSGEVKSIYSRLVYEKDDFEYSLGMVENIVHIPSKLPIPKRGNITHAYFVAHFMNGGHHLEVMDRSEIDAIRARSKSKDYGPWVTDFGEMARKTVVRRAFKYLPTSIVPVTLHAAIETEDALDVQFTQQPNQPLLSDEPLAPGTHTITPEKEKEEPQNPADEEKDARAEVKKEEEKKKKKAAAAKKKADKAQKEADEAAKAAEEAKESEGPVDLNNLELD